ncbi:MAG: gamma-glutamylcyclotransferase [Bacteroidetes bacterium]|jgi:gamma-glutamylcyclotransferase (GGCT)/AIG2-like uncharacterized protein YtfP|nr:gamma-glutamylcyclotransferase [Bacteroidota bacterium]
MEKVIQLFVYGSLRSGFKSPAYDYITKYFKLVGNARAKGILYDLGEYPVAVETEDDKFIIGELYEIIDNNAFDFIIAQLDDYEGLDAEVGEALLYKRTLIDVYVDATTSKAWSYWYCGDTTDKPIVESGDVLDYFIQKNKA